MVRTTPEQALYDVGLTALSDMIYDMRQWAAYIPIHPDVAPYYAMASQLNLPWLFFASELLHRQHPGAKIGFLGRDCRLLSMLYKAYYNDRCEYVPFSRLVALNQPDKAVEYLKASQCDLLVDIGSSGATWQRLNYTSPVKVLIYSDCVRYTYATPMPPTNFSYVLRNSIIGPTNEVVELFNSDDVGMMMTVDPVTHAEPEMSRELYAYLFNPVYSALDYKDKDKVSAQLAALPYADLLVYFENTLLSMCDQKGALAATIYLVQKNDEVLARIRTILRQQEREKTNVI